MNWKRCVGFLALLCIEVSARGQPPADTSAGTWECGRVAGKLTASVLEVRKLPAVCAKQDRTLSHEEGGGSAREGGWFQRVSHTQSEQPHWITPLVTVTPR